MSILFFEGFDLYGNYGETQQDMMSRREVWNGNYDSIDGLSFKSVNNGQAMRLDTDVTNNLSSYTGIRAGGTAKFTSLPTEIVLGMSFEKETVGSDADTAPRLFTMHGENQLSIGTDDPDYNLYAAILPNPSIDFDIWVRFTNHSNSELIVIPNVAPGIRHYLEVKCKVSAPTRLTVKLNGLVVGDLEGPSAWTKGFRSLYLHAAKDNYHPGGIWYDDMYALDVTDASDGAQFQDFLGPVQIRPCPLTADSIPSSWVASSSGAKYLDVDEQPGPNDLDATYISTVSAPQTQMMKCSPYDADLPIIAVTAFASVKQPDPTDGVAQLAFMVDDQEDAHPSPLQATYRLFSQDYTTLPGGPITAAEIEAADWGVRSLPNT